MNIIGIINTIIRRQYPFDYVHSVMDFIEKNKRAMDAIGKGVIEMFAMDEVDASHIIENKSAAYKQAWISFFDYGLDLLEISH